MYALKHVGPYSRILKAFQEVGAHAAKNGQRPRCVIGVFCDDPSEVPAEKLESYACMQVEDDLVPGGRVEALTLPAGLVATAVA